MYVEELEQRCAIMSDSKLRVAASASSSSSSSSFKHTGTPIDDWVSLLINQKMLYVLFKFVNILYLALPINQSLRSITAEVKHSFFRQKNLLQIKKKTTSSKLKIKKKKHEIY